MKSPGAEATSSPLTHRGSLAFLSRTPQITWGPVPSRGAGPITSFNSPAERTLNRGMPFDMASDHP